MPRNERTRPLIAAARIRSRVAALGREIARDYAGRDLVLVGVLNGSAIFLSDLARAVKRPAAIEFLRVRTYRGRRAGRPTVEFAPAGPIRGRDVLVVEDIVDTGVTAEVVLTRLAALKPRSLALCALLYKPGRTKVLVPIRYLGFTIPEKFVVGYGMDFEGRHRNLPDLRHID